MKQHNLFQLDQPINEVKYTSKIETPINHPTLPHYSRKEYYNDTYNQNK